MFSCEIQNDLTKGKVISIFEHESLRSHRGEKRLTQAQLQALQQHYGENGVPYYSLIHKGVKFGEYVGVIQVGDTTIEVLPKADKGIGEADMWRRMLIDMLRAVGIFNIHAPSSSSLHLRTNSILDLYFELYIKELEYLLHRGLVKKYRKKEGNSSSLKGSIQFPKHISKNLVHQERFYVRHTTYDKMHLLHAILLKALRLLSNINSNAQLNSRIGSLLLDFPELSDIHVSEAMFERITLDRKTESYRTAIEIARLILLNYHPDVRRGSNHVLALMFDMNVLWEQFVYTSLRKNKSSLFTISPQNSKSFWKPKLGSHSKMRPDIVINKNTQRCIVLDTKWKNLHGFNPSPADLRQMFVYMKYYRAQRVALIYPGGMNRVSKGRYYQEDTNELSDKECSIISVSVNQNIGAWQREISDQLFAWSSVLERI